MAGWRCVSGDDILVRRWEDGVVLYHRPTGDTFLTDSAVFSVYAEWAAERRYAPEAVREDVHRELARCRLIEMTRSDAGS